MYCDFYCVFNDVHIEMCNGMQITTETFLESEDARSNCLQKADNEILVGQITDN